MADTVGATIDALPDRGTLALIDRIELHTGGCAANTGASLAKLGVSVGILGKVGTDSFGDFIIGALAQTGAEVSGIVRDASAATAATMVTVHGDAERSFLHVIGANARITSSDVLWEFTRGARIFHIAGLQLMPALEGDGVARVLADAKQRGMITTLDTVMNPRSLGWAGIAPALPYLDWAIPSYDEAYLLTGEREVEQQVARFKDGGARNVAVKQGAAGCFVAPHDAAPFHVPVLANVRAVDSLGAGDAWSAGFLTGLLHDWPLSETARFANAVGACCVEAYGATTGVCSLADTLARLHATEINADDNTP